MMNLNKVNSFLLSIVVSLLIILALILLNILVFMERFFTMSDFSDLISAIGTAATAVVAFLAYRSAPKWLHTKLRENGYEHVSSLVKEYDQIILNIRKKHPELKRTYSTDLNYGPLKDHIELQKFKLISLASKFDSCGRWGIQPPKEYRNHLNHLNSYQITAKQVLYGNKIDIMSAEGAEKANKLRESYNQKLDDLLVSILQDEIYYQQDINQVFKFPK